MMRWSRPEIQNSVHDFVRHCQGALDGHVKAMHRVMQYVIITPNRDLTLKPNESGMGKIAISNSLLEVDQIPIMPRVLTQEEV